MQLRPTNILCHTKVRGSQGALPDQVLGEITGLYALFGAVCTQYVQSPSVLPRIHTLMIKCLALLPTTLSKFILINLVDIKTEKVLV